MVDSLIMSPSLSLSKFDLNMSVLALSPVLTIDLKQESLPDTDPDPSLPTLPSESESGEIEIGDSPLPLLVSADDLECDLEVCPDTHCPSELERELGDCNCDCDCNCVSD